MPRTQRAEIADDAFDIIPDLQQHEAFARAGPAKMFRRERIRPAREIGIGKLFAFFPDQCNLLVKFIQPGGESHPITRNYAEGRGSRSEERRVGKEGVSTCRSRWSPSH